MKSSLILITATLHAAASFAQDYSPDNPYVLTENDVVIQGDSLYEYNWPKDNQSHSIAHISIPSNIGGKNIKKN